MTEILEVKARLWGSYLLFLQTFFLKITGREFALSKPVGRESHFITVSRALTKVAREETNRLIINVPPGHGKSTMVSYWVAWMLSRYPDSQFMYISYSKTIATKHTEIIRRIISHPLYRSLFDVSLDRASTAKDSFLTNYGGSIRAFGSAGSITGQDAGLPNLDRFSGALIMDDMHKPDEVHSDTLRENVIHNYSETIMQRMRSPTVPMVFIGQRLHEGDLPQHLLEGFDGFTWDTVILKALDGAQNALYPELHSKEMLLKRQDTDIYVFSGQFQQSPVPAGGTLFTEKMFPVLDEEPDIKFSFITADTAETDKTYNDATVFSFFGIYEIENDGRKTGQFGLHWIDCIELRVEPKDLQDEFMSFWSQCMLHEVAPLTCVIEKKSTGVTLSSVLSEIRGLKVIDVKRTRASGSKTTRFLEMQQHIASKFVSFTYGAKHIPLCVKHMTKITANDTHRFDDIADTLYDGVKSGLIDKTLYQKPKHDVSKLLASMSQRKKQINRQKVARWQR